MHEVTQMLAISVNGVQKENIYFFGMLCEWGHITNMKSGFLTFQCKSVPKYQEMHVWKGCLPSALIIPYTALIYSLQVDKTIVVDC